jgi:hypothetical protein
MIPCGPSVFECVGTVFAQSQEVTDPDIKTWILKQHSPPTTSQQALESVTDKLLELYPDDPTVGSPFGTGDELFGLPSSYKRRSALGALDYFPLVIASLLFVERTEISRRYTPRHQK